MRDFTDKSVSKLQWGTNSRLDKEVPIDRVMLRDQVREYLVEAILKGMFNAGDRIVETRLAQQLGVSQGAVREAIRELEWMGFLETRPYSGTYVRRLTVSDLIELYPVRAALESLGGRLAATRLTDSQIDQLEELVQEMIRLSKAGDVRGMVEHNFSFHQTIIEASGNPTLIRFWSLFQFSYWTAISTGELIGDLVHLAQRHQDIVEALRLRDAEACGHAMHNHIMELVDSLQKNLSTHVADDVHS